MESQVEDFDNYLKEIQALLNLQDTQQSTEGLLKWTLGHPLLRPRQMSMAFYVLTARMEWTLVSACGHATYIFSATLPDSVITKHHDKSGTHPWGFFNPNVQRDAVSTDRSQSCDLSDSGNILALGIGVESLVDGLFLMFSHESLDVERNLRSFAFLRISSEFIYRHYFNQRRKGSMTDSEGIESLYSPGSKSADTSRTQITDVELTPRQQAVLKFIAQGSTNEEIAQAMHLSLGTIRVETSRLYDRLGARNRQQAATFAYLVDSL